MKILDLRKKIIKSAIVSASMVLAIAGLIFYNSSKSKKLNLQISEINSSIADIEGQVADLQGKILEIKKYTNLSKTISENRKKTDGIRMDDINAMLTKIAAKYNIQNPSIKVTLPEVLSGPLFNLKTIAVLTTSATVTFQSFNDSRAILFMTEFVESMPGYTVINNLDLKKSRSYTVQDLVMISSGKGGGLIDGEFTFSWYAFRGKTPADNAPITTESQSTSESPDASPNP